MQIRDIKGLKYPDDYFIKFFFKNGLHTRANLKYLEFGCGNGSNLMLPYQYDNEAIGVDYDAELISYAKDNFKLLDSSVDSDFYSSDMREFVVEHKSIEADILSLPNIINYISKSDFREFLENCRENNLYKEGGTFFIRFRTPKDFRFGVGKRVDSSSYRIDENSEITGEAGALNCFYRESEMIEILKKYLYLTEYEIFNIEFENIAPNGDVIFNSDIVIWGKIN
jgi:hypothetical protein